MGARILELSNGHLSLEFGTPDVPNVRKAIQEIWGALRLEEYVASQPVVFGGCDFVYQNEWDDPCLISLSVEGNPLLRQLADHLAGAE